MVAPLLQDGSDYPCKGYNRDAPLRAVATYEAGSSYNMSIVGGAPHMGGSCQLSLSYDNGATFKVIKSMIGGCPLANDYTFTIPDSAPTGTPLFAWTWFNDVGNREMYMNCAAVNVIGKSAYSSDGLSSSGMDSLPNIYLANIGSKSSCRTVEDKPVVFPDPGLDVVYGGGMSAHSPPSPQDCGGTVESSVTTEGPPSGARFFAVSTSTTSVRWINGPPIFRNGTSISTAYPPTGTLPTGFEIENGINPVASTLFPSSLHGATITDWMSSSTRGFVFFAPTPVDIPTTTFITVRLSSQSRRSTRASSTRTTTTTSTYSYYTSTSTSTSSILNSIPTSSFTICQTGQITCPSENTWSICNGQGTGYIPMGSVSPGTVCMDGKIGRAEASGECTNAVPLRCANNGNTFEVCDQGRWVNMGMVARGTVCRGGMIVPA